LDSLSQCKFSYNDLGAWQDSWDEDMDHIPSAIKMSFKFKDEEQLREFVVNIPISP